MYHELHDADAKVLVAHRMDADRRPRQPVLIVLRHGTLHEQQRCHCLLFFIRDADAEADALPEAELLRERPQFSGASLVRVVAAAADHNQLHTLRLSSVSFCARRQLRR